MNNELVFREDQSIDVLQYSGESIIAKQAAEEIEVRDAETERSAVDLAKRIKVMYSEAETARKIKKDPFLEYGRRIDAVFKPITSTLIIAEAIVKDKLNRYLEDIEKKRQEDEAERLKKFKEENDKARVESIFSGSKIVSVPIPVVELPKSNASGDYAKASQRSDWKWEVIDQSKIPADLMIPDAVAIWKKVRSGWRDIPGVRIWEEKSISIR